MSLLGVKYKSGSQLQSGVLANIFVLQNLSILFILITVLDKKINILSNTVYELNIFCYLCTNLTKHGQNNA